MIMRWRGNEGDWFPWSGITTAATSGWKSVRIGRDRKLQGRISHVSIACRARGASNISGCFTRIIIPTRSIPGIFARPIIRARITRLVRPERLRAAFKDEPNPIFVRSWIGRIRKCATGSEETNHDRRMGNRANFRMLSTSQESASQNGSDRGWNFFGPLSAHQSAIYCHENAGRIPIILQQLARQFVGRIFGKPTATGIGKSGFGQSDPACDSEKVESPNRLWRAAPSTYTS